jgi:hypothetical protein
MTQGFVYALSNPYMPNVYKIGMTERSPFKRADELSNSTSVPCSFQVMMFIAVDNMEEVESDAHQMMVNERIATNREFFHCQAREIYWALSSFDTQAKWMDPDFEHLVDVQEDAFNREQAALRASIQVGPQSNVVSMLVD